MLCLANTMNFGTFLFEFVLNEKASESLPLGNCSKIIQFWGENFRGFSEYIYVKNFMKSKIFPTYFDFCL